MPEIYRSCQNCAAYHSCPRTSRYGNHKYCYKAPPSQLHQMEAELAQLRGPLQQQVAGLAQRLEQLERAHPAPVPDAHRLAQLAQADSENRLLLLPLPLGAPVFRVTGNPAFSPAAPPFAATVPKYLVQSGAFQVSDIPELGYTVFANKEAANARLNLLNGGNSHANPAGPNRPR